jgi:soluble lytic murein transglycosylase-like protein
MGVMPMRNDSPEENVRFGQDYLAALLKRYQDVPTALAAYNWGLGNVDEWVAGGRKGRLPEETQTYIRNIVGE